MEKINIAELLKDCPKGMELDCTMYEDVSFVKIIDSFHYPIAIKTKSGFKTTLTKYGQNVAIDGAKCVIFPKGKTTWEGFQRPFVEGDIVSTENGVYIGIVKSTKDSHYCYTFCAINDNRDFLINYNLLFSRLSTEEEKATLFQAIKDNGYKWNPEAKTLEKFVEPKFKVGDTIQDVDGYKVEIAKVDIDEECYEYISTIANGIGSIPFELQDEWELVPNKFDITTLKPFESKVLVRDGNTEKWKPNFWGFYDSDHSINYPHECCGNTYRQCIPFEGNEHLLGKTDDCDEFYKTWE